MDKEFLKCWNIQNLRIITGAENEDKKNKLDFELIKKYDLFDLLPENICDIQK